MQDACDSSSSWRSTPLSLSFDASFLENPCEYLHKPYIANLPETTVPAEDLSCWQYASIFISFRTIIFESRTVGSHTNRHENRI